MQAKVSVLAFLKPLPTLPSGAALLFQPSGEDMAPAVDISHVGAVAVSFGPHSLHS